MIHVVLGEQGSGKTTRLAALVRRAAEAYPWPVFILDLRERMEGAIGNLAPIGATYENTGDYLARGVSEFSSKSGIPSFRSNYRVNLFYRTTAEDMASLAYRFMRARAPSIWVFDEIDLFPSVLVPGFRTNRGLSEPKSYGYHILHYSRPVPLLIYGSARQPQNVDKGWLSQATQLDLFRCSTRQLLGQVRESGLPGCAAVADRLPHLPRYQFLTLKG